MRRRLGKMIAITNGKIVTVTGAVGIAEKLSD